MGQFREHIWDVGDELSAAVRPRGVDIHGSVASIEFLQDGSKRRITQPAVPIARHQADAISLEFVQRVGDFPKATLSIRRRHCGEESKTPRVIACKAPLSPAA